MSTLIIGNLSSAAKVVLGLMHSYAHTNFREISKLHDKSQNIKKEANAENKSQFKIRIRHPTVLCKTQHVIDRNGGGNEKTDFFSIWFSFSVLENAVKKNRNVFISLMNNDVTSFFLLPFFFS